MIEIYLVKPRDFKENHPDVVPEHIGLGTTVILGQEVHHLCVQDEVGRDDSKGGKHELASTLNLLLQRLEVVKLEGINGVYIGGSFDVWVQQELEQDVERIRRHPELDYSEKCYQALLFVMVRGQRLVL